MPKPSRTIGLVDVYCLAAGAMVSSGIFVLPGLAHSNAGPAVIFSYFIAGIVATAGMLSVAEVITAMPKAGGDYFFVTRTMGPASGTVTGLLVWFSLTLKTSFALKGIGAFAQGLLPWDPIAVSLACCGLFMTINLFGLRKPSWLQRLLVFGLIAALGYYILRGFGYVQSDHLVPFAPKGWHAVFATAGMTFVAFGGLLNVTSVAEQVRNPGRTLPLGMLLALVSVTVIYSLTVFVTSGVVPGDILNNSLTPITLGAQSFMGPVGAVVMSLAAIAAFVSTANAGVMSASRYLLAMARDRFLPRSFGMTNQFGAPWAGLACTAAVVAISLFVELKVLVGAASTVLMLTYILANFSVIVLRESGLFNYRPIFLAPLYPWPQLVGLIGSVFLLAEMGRNSLLLSGLLITAGMLFYMFYGKNRWKREYAMQVLMERLAQKEAERGMIESELKEIVQERDERVWDRFDQVVERAIVIDVEGPISSRKVFGLVAQRVHHDFGLDPLEVEMLINDRASSGTDVVVPGVAVADILMEGCDIFELVIVRSREGIIFAEEPCTAFFLTVTCRHERRFFIQTITAMAQIAMDPSFRISWLRAESKQDLKDLIHLGERHRNELLREGEEKPPEKPQK
jgi:amino acid transporter/mannitol/fructose-specific phosphotransferase system IIA component (Ntr-type)